MATTFDPQAWVASETEITERMLRAGPGWWDYVLGETQRMAKEFPDLFTELNERAKRFVAAQRKGRAA